MRKIPPNNIIGDQSTVINMSEPKNQIKAKTEAQAQMAEKCKALLILSKDPALGLSRHEILKIRNIVFKGEKRR